MSINKPSFLTAAVIVIALSAAPFAGYVLSQEKTGAAFAQAQSDPPSKLSSTPPAVHEKDQPADTSVVLYRVMGTLLVVWIGLAVFLFRIDRKLARLEKEARGGK